MLLLAPVAGAQPTEGAGAGALSASASAGGARAVSDGHAHELGTGGWVAGALGVGVGPGVAVGASALALALPAGGAPPDAFAPRTGATLFAFGADVRARPWADAAPADDTSASLKGLWLGGSAGAALTGGVARFMFSGHLGYDVWLAPRVGLGPVVSVLYVAQPDNSVRPADAVVALAGVRLVLDPAPAAASGPAPLVRHEPADRDHDGVEDGADRCPDVPEDEDGTDDLDGCPEDDDADGVPDVADACRVLAEDRDGFQDEDGCPESDNDHDGIADQADRCPNEPEDQDGHRDDDGCPDPDNDGDGMADAADRCPNEAETKNGYVDDDGCPDEEDVRVSGNEIVLGVKIAFVPDFAPVRKGSLGLLERVARLLARHPEYARVSIEAYADGPGDAEHDRQLSGQRAEAVRRRLNEYGVGAERLEAVGRGRPQDAPARRRPGATAAERDMERSDVAFYITQRGAARGASPAEGAR